MNIKIQNHEYFPFYNCSLFLVFKRYFLFGIDVRSTNDQREVILNYFILAILDQFHI